MTETPLKGKGGSFPPGWESWKTTGVHTVSDHPLFSPLTSTVPGGSVSATTPEEERANGPRLSPSDSSDKAGFDLPVLAPRVQVNGFFSFLQRELQWGHAHTWRSRSDTSEHVMNFFRVTLSLEPFLNFGHLLCIEPYR